MAAVPQITNPHDDARPQYEQLLASIDGVIWEADPQTCEFIFVSQYAERLLGYPAHQWHTPGFWVDHLHPDDHERRSHDIAYRMLVADGRAVWLRGTVSVVVEEGAITALRGITAEITDRKRAEEVLHGREELYRLLTEHSNDLIGLFDLRGQTIYVSPSVRQLLGSDQAQLAELLRSERVHPQGLESVERACRKL